MLRIKRYRIKPRGIVILAVLAVLIIAAIAGAVALISHLVNSGSEDAKAVEAEAVSEELSILCVGDIMAHMPQYRAAYDESTDTYDFTENYKYVKKYIECADIALCNVETVFADKPLQGYPTFNAPEELATAIAGAGFDVAITSNNHMLDQGTEGVEQSLKVLRKNGLTTVGSRLTEDEKEYALVKVKGIKVGIVAYTYETTGTSTTRSLNGMAIPEAAISKICSFNPTCWDTEITKITDNITLAREAGAQIIICYFHWGEEYASEPQEYQVKMAEQIAANAGADVIFASHPHVLERAETIYSEKYKKTVPVFYSMGNFISNQRSETLGASHRNTEDGMLAEVTFTLNKEDGKVKSVKLARATALPTWTSRVNVNGDWLYEIIPLDTSYGKNESLVKYGNVSKADTSITASVATIGADFGRDDIGRVVVYG